MGANSHEDQPFRPLNPQTVALWLDKLCATVVSPGLADQLRRTMDDEYSLPRHLTVTRWPGSMAERSTSTEARAPTSEEGRTLPINGRRDATAPTAAAIPVATKRKSRHVGQSVSLP